MRSTSADLANHLHDVLGHDLTHIRIQAQLLEQAQSTQNAADIAQAIGHAAHRALNDLRRLTHYLAADDSNDSGSCIAGLAQFGCMRRTLALISDSLCEAGFKVRLRVPTQLYLPPQQQQVLNRVLYEGSTNILKHGIPNSSVDIQLVVSNHEAQLSLTNPVARKTTLPSLKPLGLDSLAQHVRQLDGSFKAGYIGIGQRRWRLQATLPTLDPARPEGNPASLKSMPTTAQSPLPSLTPLP